MADRKNWIFPGAIVLLLLSTVLSLCLGAAKLPLSALWQAIIGGDSSMAGVIFWYSRLPRTAACLLAGAALATSGCVLQTVLGNRLASPGIIGVNAGAGLSVTVCCAAGILSGWAISIAAFGGAMVAALTVMLLAKKTGAERTTVILSGVAMNSILNALRDAVTTLVPEAGMLGGDFRVGGFSAVSTQRLMPAALLILASLAVCLSLCNELDVLALGEDTAQSLGLSVRKMRTLFLILAAVLAGAAVSYAGLLGFVGLIVPHAVRHLVGNESRRLLPLCALGGAGFVTMCDLASRLVFAPFELPVGILMAIIGGPFFLWLLLKRKGGHRYA